MTQAGKNHIQSKALISAFMLETILAPASIAQGSLINHPVMCYKKTRLCDDCPYDSTLVGKITYDPMPRYQKESTMNIAVRIA